MFECLLQAKKRLQSLPLLTLRFSLFLFVTAASFLVWSAKADLPPLFIDSTPEAMPDIHEQHAENSEVMPVKPQVAETSRGNKSAVEQKSNTLPIIRHPDEKTDKTKASNSHKLNNMADSEPVSNEPESVNDKSELVNKKTTEFIYSPSKHKTNAPKLKSTYSTFLPENTHEDSLEALWQKTLPQKKKDTLIEKDIIAPTVAEPSESIKAEETPPVPLIPEEQPSKPVDPQQHAEQKTEPQQGPFIAIVIDDLGYNSRGMKSSLALPVEVTLAILPNTPFSKATAKASKEQNRTIILHAPMENTRQLKLGPGGLYSHMKEKEFKKVLTESIESIPGITGVNNHMGSLLTQNKQHMQWVMETLKPMKLFFIDSVTSGNSVAYQEAKAMNITAVKRNVFLDNLQNEEAIHKQFQRLIRIAKKDGKALAIGHPYPSTMQYLHKRLPTLSKEGIKLVSINEYIQLNETNL